MDRYSTDWNKKTMPAIASSPSNLAQQSGPMLRVWDPEQDAVQDETIDPILTDGKHRIHDPVPRKTRRKPDATGQQHIWDSSPLDPSVVAAAQRSLDKFRDPTISPEQRAWLRANLTLRQFYCDWMEPERRQAVIEGRMSPETISKDKQVISRWEAITKPDDWNCQVEWPGQPIGATSGQLVQAFLAKMKSRGYADGTCLTTKTHLATIFHKAQKLGLIDPIEIKDPAVDRSENRHFSEDEASRAYLALKSRPLLQAAFVISLATGARPRDLFSLRCSDVRLDRSPIVRFETSKTGVYLAIPLAPISVCHLARLDRTSEWLFPGLGSPTAKYPERSTPSRRRNALMKSLLLAAGVFDQDGSESVAIEHPWQVGRSTAATWIERVARGMSSVLLGHASDDGPKRVTSVHYLPREMEPSSALIAAVNAVEWPDVFKAM